MTTTLWLIEKDGVQQYLGGIAEPDGVRWVYDRKVAVDRAPSIDGHESWDFTAGAWVTDADLARAWTDRQYRMLYGDHAITEARLTKAIEARLILAGVEVNGYVAAEAAATGQTVSDLATIIVGNADAVVSAEVDRIVAKRDLAEGGETST